MFSVLNEDTPFFRRLKFCGTKKMPREEEEEEEEVAPQDNDVGGTQPNQEGESAEENAEGDNPEDVSEENEEENEEGNEGDAAVSSSATNSGKKKKQPWDAETDKVVKWTRAFFEAYPNGPVSQQSTIDSTDDDGNLVTEPIGKTMYTLRTKSRAPTEKQTELTRDRINALNDIPGFMSFLEQPIVSKPKASPEVIHMGASLNGTWCTELTRVALFFEKQYYQNMLHLVTQEAQLLKRKVARQDKPNKKRRSS